jgi:hypothetical protein
MTEEDASRFALTAEPQLSLENLRSLRAEIDAILTFLPSDSTREKDRHEAQKHKARKSVTQSVRTGDATRQSANSAEHTVVDAAPSSVLRNRGGTRNQGGRG